jgi:parallel beta-helix repeat protein
VQFNAPVVLANDVEIDAGTGDAVFAGTVDAAAAGEQSLTVTALGATTFGAAVGGQTPLAGLLTRAITPLSITQSADTKTIPLRYLPTYNANGQPQVKYGIDVAIGNNPSQIYEFDTGGTAFYAGYSPSFWQNVPLSTNGIAVTYSSGNYYDAVVSNTVITIGAGSQTVSTGQPIQVGAILAGGNSNSHVVFDFTNPAAPPVESHFFGDFGASFAVAPGNGLPTPMANPLFQLPGNLSSGFLVQLGPIGVTPQLSVGITDALRDQFPYAIPVAQLVGGGTYPVSGYPVLQEFGFFPQYFAQDGTNPKQPIGTEVFPQCQTGTQCLPTLIDSGAPTTGIRLKNTPGGDPYNDDGRLRSGVTFIAEFPTSQGRPALEWKFTAGETGSVDLVQYQDGSVATNTQNVNTGLTLYNYYDVMFDVQEQVIWLRPTGGQATVTLKDVTTTGDQTYRQNAELAGSYRTNGGSFSVAGVTTLAGDTTVTAQDGDVTFSGTIDGAHSVVVNASGATAFVRGVGSTTALVSLRTDSGGSTATAGVSTTGSQSYGDDVTLSGPYRTTDGDFSVAGSAGLGGPASIETGGTGKITFAGTVDSQPSRGLTLSLTTAGGDIALGDDVGAVNPLGGLILASTASSGATSATAAGAINLDGKLSFANLKGLAVGKSVTVDFANGGLIQNFKQDGITLDQTDNSNLSGFIVSNNAGGGIKATSVEDLVLADNAVIGNGAAGITVAGGKNVTITGSSILGGGADGILLTGTQNQVVNTEISDNAITGNADNGIDAESANRLTITGNTINTNGNSGIVSLRTDDVEISGNTISGNIKDGVAVDQGTGNQILSNSISLNLVKGISLQNGGNNNQAAPTVAEAVIQNGRLIVTGTLANPPSEYILQVFYSPAPVNPLAPPVQGTQLLQSSTETTIAFSVNVPGGSLWGGDYVTVTATVNGDTSAFSAPVLIATV